MYQPIQSSGKERPGWQNAADLRERIHGADLAGGVGQGNPTSDALSQKGRHFEGSGEEQELLTPGLTKLFNRPWWSRVWVVQEAILSRQPPLVGCGRQWVSWKAIIPIMNDMTSREMKRVRASREGICENDTSTEQFLEIARRKTRAAEVDRWDLSGLLYATSNRKQTQPHDANFGILGLAIPAVTQELNVDYSQPYSQLFPEAMVHVLKQGHLDILLCAMSDRGHKDIPSWCIDFSQLNINRYTESYGWYSSLWYASADLAGGGVSGSQPPSTITHNINLGTLEISGTIIGRVARTAPSACASKDFKNLQLARKDYDETSAADQRTPNNLMASTIYEDALSLSHAAHLKLFGGHVKE